MVGACQNPLLPVHLQCPFSHFLLTPPPCQPGAHSQVYCPTPLVHFEGPPQSTSAHRSSTQLGIAPVHCPSLHVTRVLFESRYPGLHSKTACEPSCRGPKELSTGSVYEILPWRKTCSAQNAFSVVAVVAVVAGTGVVVVVVRLPMKHK